MRSVLIAFLLTGLMIADRVDFIVAWSSTKVPEQIVDWREASQGNEQVVKFQTQTLFDMFYSETLSRIYVFANRYSIMQNINYGQ